MAHIKRKAGENFENFLRRYNTALKNSKKIKTVQKKRYLVKPKTKAKSKLSALFGMKIQKKREYLQKIGKFKGNSNKKW